MSIFSDKVRECVASEKASDLKKLSKELGCGDSGCILGQSGGMMTNGGCRCFRRLKLADRMKVHEMIFRLIEIIREK